MQLIKTRRFPGYNYNFYDNGIFMRWGNSFKENDDPQFSPVGPEIADIEVSTICHGPNGIPCPWCYKSNTSQGQNMTLHTFNIILRKINSTGNLTQIAFGIGDIDANSDLIAMFRSCRKASIFPNITVNGARLDLLFEGKSYAEHIAELCGAVAVSHYGDDQCFDAVKKFTDLGMTQVNIHKILAEETIDDCLELLKKRQIDSRLANMNAIVFLLLKPKGDRNTLTPIKNMIKYRELIHYALDNSINIGFDSCGAHKFMAAISGHKDFKHLSNLCEPCESTLFSIYINVKGEMFPCSFGEGTDGWENGIDIVKCEDFLRDVWYHPRVKEWRNKNLSNNRNCVFYNV